LIFSSKIFNICKRRMTVSLWKWIPGLHIKNSTL
jgi:hypothetical protein